MVRSGRRNLFREAGFNHVPADALQFFDQQFCRCRELHVGEMDDADPARHLDFRKGYRRNLFGIFLNDRSGVPADHVTLFEQ